MMPSTDQLTRLEPSTAWSGLEPQAPDALLEVIKLHRSDLRPEKIDVGVGVYRDGRGNTPIMRAVKAAERVLADEQVTKSYLGADGDSRFTELIGSRLLGDPWSDATRATGIQTPGGTGALRLGVELIARATPNATVWLSDPTWPNHVPIITEVGLSYSNYRFYDAATSQLDFGAMMTSLAQARPGDIVLLHGCCHNPTGEGFSSAQWRDLVGFFQSAGLTPLVDLAYQGLGDGLEADAAGIRTLGNGLPNALLAYSCDKNFGLYRERVGGLWVLGEGSGALDLIRSNMLQLARSLWSMPPDHGAAIVRTILDTADLDADWRSELDFMRARMNSLRQLLGAAHPRLAPIARQRGMFALLPIGMRQVVELRAKAGIYMPNSGRINVAGLTEATITPFVEALLPHLSI